MLARFAAKRPPDVFYVDSLDVPDYLPALEPLNCVHRRRRATGRRSRSISDSSAGSRSTAEIYGFPKDWSPLGLIANTQMLQRAGVTTPPATWAQFTQTLQRIRSSNAVPGGAPACLSLDWARILRVRLSEQRRLVQRDQDPVGHRLAAGTGRRSTRTSAGCKSGLAQTPAQLGVGWCGEAIGKEKAAIVFEGNWIYGYLQKDFPSVRFARLPDDPQRDAGQPLVHRLVLDREGSPTNKQAAWRLLRFLVGKQGQAVWAKNSGFLPSRSDVDGAAGRANFVREAPYAQPWQFIKGFQRVIDFAAKELEATLNGDQTVAQMLADIDRETQDAIRRSR